ncbi:hypothetical protein F4604DRAFT_2043233 [Suillus subluteus]|nr:hypothetical protein F4604DRAFT_2043233 [Suillus subluteus]
MKGMGKQKIAEKEVAKAARAGNDDEHDEDSVLDPHKKARLDGKMPIASCSRALSAFEGLGDQEKCERAMTLANEKQKEQRHKMSRKKKIEAVAKPILGLANVANKFDIGVYDETLDDFGSNKMILSILVPVHLLYHV